MQVTVWCEGQLTNSKPDLALTYPEGMEHCLADAIRERHPEYSVTTATQGQRDCGLPPELVANTDVLVWWGHLGHDDVPDELVDRLTERVLGGMGLVVLHSGHFSKIFRRLTGTTCALSWRNDGDRETIWAPAPHHPIATGVSFPIVLPHHETYGEPFDIPSPDDLVFISNHAGGEVFRSGMTFTRGRGRIFYFSPGDESYPVFRQPDIRRILSNAVEWVAPSTKPGRQAEAQHITRGSDGSSQR